MTSSTIRISRVTGGIGALVEGIDLASIDDEGFATVRDALVEHQVLFFRDQHLDDDQHRALVRRWADPMVFPVAALRGGTEALGFIVDDEANPPDADGWHTDITWWPEPPSVAVLCALTIPAYGGDTMWCDLHRLYDGMAPAMRALAEQLVVHHSPGERFIAVNARIGGEEVGRLIAEQLTGAHHPLVRSHPVTGRPALFLSSFIRSIDGMSTQESDTFLEPLYRRLDDPNGQVRWRWREGDVAIWDEANTNHRALSDHYPQFRKMRRCTASGERPFFSPDGTRANASIVTRASRELADEAAGRDVAMA
jgi:taurine dioxygenase